MYNGWWNEYLQRQHSTPCFLCLGWTMNIYCLEWLPSRLNILHLQFVHWGGLLVMHWEPLTKEKEAYSVHLWIHRLTLDLEAGLTSLNTCGMVEKETHQVLMSTFIPHEQTKWRSFGYTKRRQTESQTDGQNGWRREQEGWQKIATKWWAHH